MKKLSEDIEWLHSVGYRPESIFKDSAITKSCKNIADYINELETAMREFVDLYERNKFEHIIVDYSNTYGKFKQLLEK
jgi:hypothetical protein